MSLEMAMAAMQIMVSLAVFQQSVEHASGEQGMWRGVFVARAAACLWLLTGVLPLGALGVLWCTGVAQLHRFAGPYNGGSDKVTMLIITCLTLAHLAPSPMLSELAIAYLAVQIILSYFVSGYVKIVKSEWRSGQALAHVFWYSAYPQAESLRGWRRHPALLRLMSWGVMGFEVAFPLALLHPWSLWVAMATAGTFHLANACLFGLNRFFWIWICAYPSLIWFQDRLFG